MPQQYYDVNGNPISIGQKTYYDVNGNSIGLKSPQAVPVLQNPTKAIMPKISDLSTYVPGILSALGGTIGALGGPAGAVGGAGLGSMAGTELKNEFPNTFGERPNNMADFLGQTGEDVLGNAVIPEVGGAATKALLRSGKPIVNLLASKIFRNTKGVQGALAQDTIDQASNKLSKLLYPQSDVLDTAAENVGITNEALNNNIKNAKPDLNTAIQRYNEQLGSNRIGLNLKSLNEQSLEGSKVAGQFDYGPITKKALSDVTQVRNFKLAAGEPYTIEQLANKEVIGGGFSPTSGSFDPDKILSAFDGPKSDIYNEAIRPQTKKNIINLANAVKEAQNNLGDQGSEGTIKYFKHRLIFDVAIMAGSGELGHLTGSAGSGLALGTSIVLGNAALTKLMSNPVTAQAVITAIKNPVDSEIGKIAGHVVAAGLRGTSVLLTKPDGTTENGFVNQDGQLQNALPTGGIHVGFSK